MKTAREFAHRNGPLTGIERHDGEAVEVTCALAHNFGTSRSDWYHSQRCDDETATIEAARADAIEAAVRAINSVHAAHDGIRPIQTALTVAMELVSAIKGTP